MTWAGVGGAGVEVTLCIVSARVCSMKSGQKSPSKKGSSRNGHSPDLNNSSNCPFGQELKGDAGVFRLQQRPRYLIAILG